MGYELTYDESGWSVYSTVVSSFLVTGLKTPEAIADFILAGKQNEELRAMWIREALDVKAEGKSGIAVTSFQITSSGLRPTGSKVVRPEIQDVGGYM